MTINPKVWSFPSFPISKQLFAASGAAFEAGMTVGGVRMISPEPGGRASLELQPSLQVGEWQYPVSSWLMSKINGDIFRIRLAPTPQIATRISGGVPWGASGIYPDSPWSNQENWEGDVVAQFKSVAFQGSNTVQIDMSFLGQILQHGHVIGHGDNCYIVDDISYNNTNNMATVVVNPPFRKNVAINDLALMRPFFLGTISNGDEMRTTYDAENVGYIQLGRIKFNEVIL